MRIAIHTTEKTGYPNLALMKISAWHKSQGDIVEWYMPYLSYDIVYSSKVFTWTEEASPTGVLIRGGSGHGTVNHLPDSMEHIFPDYSMYPAIDYSLGFLTRGCPRKCSWCVVPEKEGNIKPHAHFEEFLRPDSRHVVLMDNNPLAHAHGLSEIERLADAKLKVDFNQGLDARIIADNPEIASLLGKLKWLKPLRMACDTKVQMDSIEKAVRMLRESKCTPRRYFCYVLVNDIEDALERVEFLRDIGVDPFAQPYRDFENNIEPTQEQKHFARWVNHKAVFKSCSWRQYKTQKGLP